MPRITPKSPTAAAVAHERKVNGWSQSVLAERLRDVSGDATWSRDRVASVETDRLTVSLDVLIALSKALDLSYDQLIHGLTRRDAASRGSTER